MAEKPDLTTFDRELLSSVKMMDAARDEFEAAVYTGDRMRIEAARLKVVESANIWCDNARALIESQYRKFFK